jgi:hypothetical protein
MTSHRGSPGVSAQAMALRRIHPHTHFRVTDLVRLFLASVVVTGGTRQAGRLGGSGGDCGSAGCSSGDVSQVLPCRPLTRELRQAFYYPRQSGGALAARPVRH